MACSQPVVSPQVAAVADEPGLVSLPAEELGELAVASPRVEAVADEPGLASLLAEERAEAAVVFPRAEEADSTVASRRALAAALALVVVPVATAARDPGAR